MLVAGNYAYATDLLPHLLSQFHQRYPGLRIAVRCGLSSDVIRQVESGEIDVGIVRSRQVPASLNVTLVGTEEVVVVESARNPIVGHDSASLDDIAGRPFVAKTLAREWVGNTLDHLLLTAGLEPRRIVMEVDTYEGVKAAVVAGIGLGIVSRSILSRELGEGFRIVRIAGYEDVRPVVIISQPRPVGGASSVFGELLELLQTTIPPYLRDL